MIFNVSRFHVPDVVMYRAVDCFEEKMSGKMLLLCRRSTEQDFFLPSASFEDCRIAPQMVSPLILTVAITKLFKIFRSITYELTFLLFCHNAIENFVASAKRLVLNGKWSSDISEAALNSCLRREVAAFSVFSLSLRPHSRVESAQKVAALVCGTRGNTDIVALFLRKSCIYPKPVRS